MSLSQRITQKTKLSQRQLQKLDQKLTLRLSLLQTLYGDTYRIEGECPDCHHKNTPAEVLDGFMQDVNDFTTKCKKCECRFDPKLSMKDKYGETTIPFYCKDQATHKLTSLGVMTPEEFIGKPEIAGVYRSLMIHFGSLRLAYKDINIDYPYAELEEWKKKVRPFLGKLSDTEIASICGVKSSEVKELRESFGIMKKGTFIT